MEVEAGLVPPGIRLNTTIRQYAFRTYKLPPLHPIQQATIPSNAEELTTSPLRTTTSSTQKQTQLERISNSISRYTQLDNVETIQHYYFAPWDKDIPYKVNISSLSKEEAAIAHTSTLEQFSGTNTTTIYTDASSTPEGRGIGIGLVAKTFLEGNSTSTTTYESTTNIGLNQLVYNGELEGATLAIEYASSIATTGQNFHRETKT